jgi:hypothetical protein
MADLSILNMFLIPLRFFFSGDLAAAAFSAGLAAAVGSLMLVMSLMAEVESTNL